MQKLLITDYEKIKPFLDYANYEGANSNFVTMMMWDHEYDIQYEIHDNFMIMLHTYMNEKFFAMPFCKEEYYLEAVEYMKEYAKKNNFPFKISLAIESSKKQIEKLYQDEFLYLHNRDFDDYVYTKASLQTLSGKKMQKRRNHFNAFIKENPQYIYKEIEDVDIDNVLQCLKEWDFSKQLEKSVISEYVGIVYLLIHRKELNIKTGCIYIDGKLEAFIIASPLKHNTIQIHVEKANKNIRGLYVAICKFFLDNNFEDYEFVNREEDMGLESLRVAKQNLHPIKMVEKYTIVYNNQKITRASDEDLYDIIDLWRASFKDENELTTNFYFMNRYKKENTFILKNNDELVSMMQIVPFKINENDQEIDTYFILGVATNKNYQNLKMMKKLMNYVLALPEYKGAKIMLQAYNPPIYYNFGFKETYFHQKVIIDLDKYKNCNTNILTTNDKYDYDTLVALYNSYCSKYHGYRIRNTEYYQKYLSVRCQSYKEKIKLFYENNEPVGYVIFSQSDAKINISEIIYTSADALNQIISYFAKIAEQIIVETDLTANLIGESEKVCTMMTNYVNEVDDTLFINECL